jgi:hypothetical protein
MVAKKQKSNKKNDRIIATIRHCKAFLILRILRFGFFDLFIIFGIGSLLSLGGYPNLSTIILLLGGFALFSFVMIYFVIRSWKNTFYEIRETSLIYHRVNFLFTKTEFYTLNANADFKLKQSWISRLFGCGNIIIVGPTIEDKIVMRWIPSPHKYLKKFIKLISKVEQNNDLFITAST